MKKEFSWGGKAEFEIPLAHLYKNDFLYINVYVKRVKRIFNIGYKGEICMVDNNLRLKSDEGLYLSA